VPTFVDHVQDRNPARDRFRWSATKSRRVQTNRSLAGQTLRDDSADEHTGSHQADGCHLRPDRACTRAGDERSQRTGRENDSDNRGVQNGSPPRDERGNHSSHGGERHSVENRGRGKQQILLGMRITARGVKEDDGRQGKDGVTDEHTEDALGDFQRNASRNLAKNGGPVYIYDEYIHRGLSVNPIVRPLGRRDQAKGSNSRTPAF
jgi:hypothetical protein